MNDVAETYDRERVIQDYVERMSRALRKCGMRMRKPKKGKKA